MLFSALSEMVQKKSLPFQLSESVGYLYCKLRSFYNLTEKQQYKIFGNNSSQATYIYQKNVALLKAEIFSLAKQLPEYDVVMGMFGVGEITGAQLMAEIGDVRRFPNRSSLVAFASVDPSVNQSGKYNAHSNSTTKRGSSHLRKTLFQIVSTYIKRSPADEPVYQFICKKRSEGKPYYVYMTAAENKFCEYITLV